MTERLMPEGETWQWQGFALRAYGEAIEEIGLRELDRPLDANEIAAVRFLARNVLAWCGTPVEEQKQRTSLMTRVWRWGMGER